MPRSSSRVVPGLLLLAGLLLAFPVARAKDALDELEGPAGNNDGRKVDQQGNWTIRIVAMDGKPIDGERFSRGIPGQLAVRDFPHVFSLEGQSLFAAGMKLEAKLPAAGAVSVFCPPDPGAEDTVRYKPACSANIPPGRYTIDPFGLEFEVSDSLKASHPALTVDGSTLEIRTVPVTFRAADAGTGDDVPLTNFQIAAGKADLLDHLVESTGAKPPAFGTLTLYLPPGIDYRTSLGNFRIDEQGRVTPGDLAPRVKFENGTFTDLRASSAPQHAPVGKGAWLLSHNLRRVFKRGEVARFDVILSPGLAAAPNAPVFVTSGGTKTAIGFVALPATDAGSDSRLLLVDTAQLGPGKYDLSLDVASAHPFTFEVVDLSPTTPILLFTVNSCGESDFSLDPAGMDELRNTGVRCWTSYGFGSVLGRITNPQAFKDPYPTAPADAPAELRRPIDPPRVLLEDSLRHGLITYDFENRRAGWYNEGLAFHHTHPMTVDRMVRRVQIFGQEYEDYPAFAGMSYTWFPSLGGYVEGSIPTDPFFNTRMELLRRKVKEQTGFEPLTTQEQQRMQTATGEELALLTQKARNYWRAEQRLGWYGALSLYNAKLREVRKDFVCTMSENAGHDSGKSLADMAEAHDAMSFESYTDFGDWPMSAGFTTDWAHGQVPDKPEWQAVEASQSEPMIVAKQFCKFARGCEGIANSVHPPTNARSNRRHALTNRFLERYGPLVTDWSADTQIAVCVGDAQFGEYDAHAIHSHLTRLGYGPTIVAERTLEKTGVPAGIKAVFVPNLRVPFSAAAQKALDAFIARGGKVVLVGEKSLPMPGAIRVETPLKTLWDVGGFAAHLAFWDEFKKVRPALQKTLDALGLVPRNGADPERALILPSKSGGIPYVTVISSPLTSKDTDFEPISAVPVRVGSARHVVNLITGAELPVNGGAVSVDLFHEPVAFLALLDALPQAVTLRVPAKAVAGEEIELSAEANLGSSGRVPVEYLVKDSAGSIRLRQYRLSHDSRPVRYRLPAGEPAGKLAVTASELLTGVTATASIEVAPAKSITAVTEADPVYLPHPDRMSLFLSRKPEVRVIVEERQRDALPEAQKIVEALKHAGRSASIQQVSGSSYDMYWLRWVPTPLETDTLARIDKGEIIGYRGDLAPYVSTSKKVMIPEKGGWTDIDPPYVTRSDVVLFSGGRLSDSLSAVSDWMRTENVPGRGRGAIEVSLSPFWADRDVVTVVSNDDAGRRKTVDRLLALIAAGGKVESTIPFPPAAAVASASSSVTGTARLPIETPLKGFVPPALAEALSVGPDGSAAVQLKHATAIVTPDGSVKVLPRFDIAPQFASNGQAFGGAVKVLSLHPTWHFATAWAVNVELWTPAGPGSSFAVPQAFEAAGDMYDGWSAGFAPSFDGGSYFAGRDGGGFFLFDLKTHTTRKFDPPAGDLRFYEQTRTPIMLTSARYSPDGSRIAYTTGTHPSGYGALGNPPADAKGTALRVIDSNSGQIVWSLAADKFLDTSLAAANDCLAVSDRAERVALIDWNHTAELYDAAGKPLLRKPIFDWHARYQNNPKPLRCELSRDGKTALFASDANVLVTDGQGATVGSWVVPALADARLSADGSTVFVADADGLVTAFDRAGSRRWSFQTQGEKPRLGVTGDRLLVAEGAGNLLTLDPGGKVIRRVNFADPAPHPASFEPVAMNAGPTYAEPKTLETLQKFGAKKVAGWEPAGESHERWGRRFYSAANGLTLAAEGSGQRLVHLVYRHAEKPARVTLGGGEHPITFELDLPTPEYRVVDLPCAAGRSLDVSIAPCPGLEVAELSVYSFTFPGNNALFVRPAGASPDADGLDLKKPASADGDTDIVLDDKDPSAVAKAAAGKMKNAAIFATNPDPNQVEGHYIRATGNPLLAFDGQKFTDGSPAAWTKGDAGPYGSRLLVDLNHLARPKLCVTYERTLKQSEVMRGIAVLKGKKADFNIAEAGPDRLGGEPRVVAGLHDNDQFFNIFQTNEVEMEALGVYVISRDGKDLGLSEIELYE